jgi:hypothetical protein
MKPKWVKLLEEQRYVNGRMGLTVPFLIGALREPPGSAFVGDPTISEIRNLLASMMDYSRDHSGMRVYECQTLRQPTVMLEESWGAEAVHLPDGSPSHLYAWLQYFSSGAHDVESLSQGLWDRLNDSIRVRRFSYRLGSYQEFNNEDLDFIARAFARQDDAEEW